MIAAARSPLETPLAPAPARSSVPAQGGVGAALAAPGVTVGPATVLDADGPSPRVALGDGRVVEAALALALPYRPATGDVLLVIGQADAHWVVGVIAGRGSLSLELEGDVSLRAVGGRLDLVGDEGVHVTTPSSVVVRAGTFETFADALVEKVGRATTWVKEALSLRAGSCHRQIDEEDNTLARRSITLARETVKIDAHAVHLGH